MTRSPERAESTRSRVVALLLVLAMATAACSDSDEDVADSTGATDTTSSTTTSSTSSTTSTTTRSTAGGCQGFSRYPSAGLARPRHCNQEGAGTSRFEVPAPESRNGNQDCRVRVAT